MLTLSLSDKATIRLSSFIIQDSSIVLFGNLQVKPLLQQLCVGTKLFVIQSKHDNNHCSSFFIVEHNLKIRREVKENSTALSKTRQPILVAKKEACPKMPSLLVAKWIKSVTLPTTHNPNIPSERPPAVLFTHYDYTLSPHSKFLFF